MASSSLPAFVVRRGDPVLVAPAAPTPREVKPLSDIDDAEGMRFYSSGIHLYRNNKNGHQDPARVIREALGRALKAVCELARGASAPSVTPSWGREIFTARQPPRPTFPHLEYREPAGGTADRMLTTPPHDMVCVPFFFGPREIAALRNRAASSSLPPQTHGTTRSYSRFELVAACVWRCRAAALGYAHDDEVRLSFIVNARGRGSGVPLPEGFYGNAFAYTVAAATAGELCGRDLGYALGW
ncbi:hypothetical protein PR202_gb23449 [Eleusine coracana subsp. coracana]|uniref:Benzyl alcohol O-benzoyltransferase n=1 Tax=Eleusine coracana subsp. coracana TaxID=191504 RepID=A0AAV5FGA0_ELECO|nr:hypothetical protein PR202_gb23449 [Eleusine coracana subsp. coracana]